MTTPPTSPAFNFDAWATLARRNPQGFEILRKHIIDQAIKRASPHKQRRLRCLQWKLDQIRNISRTPLQASLRINRLLWENVTGPQGLLNKLQTASRQDSNPCQTAKILPFPVSDANNGLLQTDE
jgi:hypothetical protein